MTEKTSPVISDLKPKKPAPMYIDATKFDEESLQDAMKGNIPIKFDWGNKWLKGDEYSHILSNMDSYCKVFNLPKFTPKTHPDSIYMQPESKPLIRINHKLVDGMLYFVKGNTIGSDFGFPRLGIKKRYKW